MVCVCVYYLTSIFTTLRPSSADYGLVDLDSVASRPERFLTFCSTHQRYLNPVQFRTHRITCVTCIECVLGCQLDFFFKRWNFVYLFGCVIDISYHFRRSSPNRRRWPFDRLVSSRHWYLHRQGCWLESQYTFFFLIGNENNTVFLFCPVRSQSS